MSWWFGKLDELLARYPANRCARSRIDLAEVTETGIKMYLRRGRTRDYDSVAVDTITK